MTTILMSSAKKNDVTERGGTGMAFYVGVLSSEPPVAVRGIQPTLHKPLFHGYPRLASPGWGLYGGACTREAQSAFSFKMGGSGEFN